MSDVKRLLAEAIEWWSAVTHGRKPRTNWCSCHYPEAVAEKDQTEASRSWAYAEDGPPLNECHCIPGQPHTQDCQ